ncbi:Serine threonine- kinase CTR1 [Chlorella sorokiniana]|uniref:Serine threonine-kinase CTR1 n=1 Tax=Chlorella sorokiniana TaxID=3076 RepID=A0A2P6TZN7_CHLSO|nr:Serine threonine- kinase CTR1 [Chlorella sorokiniana]|eukprot:PRW59527.1 Serine threonine- kinase CTR1 [Chlorella sorokiniana]
MRTHGGQRLAALLLALAWGAASQPLQRSEAYQSTFTGAGGAVVSVLASGVELAGQELARTATTSPAGCAAACYDDVECSWFNWSCLQSQQAECTDGQCTLLASNCTLTPPVATRGGSGTAGFPLRELPPSLPGYTARAAAGISGDDLECPGSILTGVCAFSSEVDAAAVCAALPECRAVTFYGEGIDGCGGGPVALIKRSILSPDNEFVSPSVYTMEISERTAISSTYLQNGQATVLLPDDASASLASVNGAELANSSVWLGCIVAQNALMEGSVVAVLDSTESAEQCCRACREWPDGECNVFNFCSEAAGCSYEQGSNSVKLQAGECQLLHQQLVEPRFGWPPAVLAKGNSIPFVAGAPVAVTGPEVPGFTRRIARGLFGQPGYTCNGTLTPMLNECYLSKPLPDLATTCLDDEQCRAFVYKPAGFFLSAKDAAFFRREDGADLVASVYTPTSVLYAREDAPAAAGESGGSSGLSAGAAAGIAIGAVALAVALAGGGWVLLRRHRRSIAAATSAGELGKSAAEVSSDQSKPVDGPDSRPSTQSSTLPGGAAPQQKQLLGGLDPAQQAACLQQQQQLLQQQGRLLDSAEPPPDTPIGPRAPLATAMSDRSSAELKLAASGWAGWASTRPVLPSPFAAASVRRSLDAAGSLQMSPVSGEASAATPLLSDEERSEVVEELLQHRALQEAAELTGSPADTSASGGHSSGSGSAGSAPAMSQLLAALPQALQQWVVPRAEIEYSKKPDGSLRLLGEGASGRVIKAHYAGEEVAVKEIKLDRAVEVRNQFIAEAARLNSLRHAHIITFYGVSWDEANSTGCIITEFCSGRDLQSVLQLRSARSGERMFGWWRSGRRIAVEVAKALAYLHRQGIVHMDIKSSNVLLTATGSAKLADVGVSRMQTRTYLSETIGVVGTWAWIAPEVLMGCRCTLSVDLYSFGVLLWEIATGERPVRGQLRMPVVPEEAPQELVDVMQDCMNLEATARPTAHQLLQRLQELAHGRNGD